MVWEYIGEVLAPSVLHRSLPLASLQEVPSPLTQSGKAAVLVAKTLVQCQTLEGSTDAVAKLWAESDFKWSTLGVKLEEVEDFLVRQVCTCDHWADLALFTEFRSFSPQKLEYLRSADPPSSSSSSSSSATPPSEPTPYLADITQLFSAADTTNDEIFDWIEVRVSR